MIPNEEIDFNEEQLQQLNLQISVGQKASAADNIFLNDYISSRQIQLINEFITTPVSDSKKIFDIKYKLDAVLDLKNTVKAVIDAGEIAQRTISETYEQAGEQ